MRIPFTLAFLSLSLAATMRAGGIQTNQFVFNVPVGPYTTKLELSYASGFIEIPAVKFGWYTQDGLTSPSANYMAGLCNCGVNGATVEVRDFFVFDIPDTFGPFTDSTLELTQGLSSVFPPGSLNVYRVYDVSPTQIGALLTQTGDVSTFDDLGTGLSYGTANQAEVLTYTSPGPIQYIGLNSGAVTPAINNARGGLFALGGALLTINPAPEPATWSLVGTAIAAAILYRRRRVRNVSAPFQSI